MVGIGFSSIELPPYPSPRVRPLFRHIKEGTAERAANTRRPRVSVIRLVRLRTCISSFMPPRPIGRGSEFLLLYPSAVAVVIIVMGFLSRRRDKRADGKEFEGRKKETVMGRERERRRRKKHPSKSLILIQKESGGRGYTNNIRP